MEDNNKLGSLNDMTQESFNSRPEQAPDAIVEYLDNITKEQATNLKSKLKNLQYYEQFKIAITQTSLMVFIALYKATNNKEEIDDNEEEINEGEEKTLKWSKYISEYLYFARNDDKDIYDMRLFYLNNLTSSEMGIGSDDSEENEENELTSEEENIINQESLRTHYDYDNMMDTLKEQYIQRSIHI